MNASGSLNIKRLVALMEFLNHCSKNTKEFILQTLPLRDLQRIIERARFENVSELFIARLENLYYLALVYQPEESEDDSDSDSDSDSDKGKEEAEEQTDDKISWTDVSHLSFFANETETQGESEGSASFYQNVIPMRSQWTFGQSNEK